METMRTHNFDQLTAEDNTQVNYLLEKYNRLYNRGWITKNEADFLFQKSVMDEFPQHAFEICTNRDDFQK